MEAHPASYSLRASVPLWGSSGWDMKMTDHLHEDDCSPTSHARIKNEWGYTSTPHTCAFMAQKGATFFLCPFPSLSLSHSASPCIVHLPYIQNWACWNVMNFGFHPLQTTVVGGVCVCEKSVP